MQEYLPYIVSIVCAVIAAISSIFISKKEIKGEIEKLTKQHELNLETERQKHQYELEKQELEHKHQMELLQKESENKLGAEVVNTFVSEVVKSSEMRQQISNGFINSKMKKH